MVPLSARSASDVTPHVRPNPRVYSQCTRSIRPSARLVHGRMSTTVERATLKVRTRHARANIINGDVPSTISQRKSILSQSRRRARERLTDGRRRRRTPFVSIGRHRVVVRGDECTKSVRNEYTSRTVVVRPDGLRVRPVRRLYARPAGYSGRYSVIGSNGRSV